MDLSQPFNLTNVSGETLKAYCLYLEQMLVSPGWKLMEHVLEGNMALLERQIVTKREALTARILSDAEVDKLRDQHQIVEELLQKPKQLIEKYGEKKAGIPAPEYDPYQSVPEGTERVETLSNTT